MKESGPVTKAKQKPISILMRDIKMAQEISRYLRRRGEVVYFYESLEVFWEEVTKDQAKLLIVDVELMSQGALVLKNHPLLQKDGMPLIFYFTEQSKPLLMSTKSFMHMGLLKGSDAWEQDLHALLKRVSHFDSILKRYRGMEQMVRQRDTSLRELQRELSKNKQALAFKNEFSRLFYDLQNRLKSEDFLTAIAKTFGNWKVVKQMSVFTLDTIKRKLICEKLPGHKYALFPDIWPGDNVSDGINGENRETLFEVVVTNWGTNTLGLKLGVNEHELDYFLMLNVDGRYFESFSWHELEERLNYYFVREKISLGQELKESAFGMSNVYELFELIDQDFCRDRPAPSLALYDVNLSGLSDFIEAYPDNQFSFKSFYKNFVGGLKKLSTVPVDCVASSHEHIAVVGEFKDRDYLFQLLKKYIKSFPYFRFFEGDDLALADNPQIQVKMIPTSSEAYRQYLDNGSELIYHKVMPNQRELPANDSLRFPVNEI